MNVGDRAITGRWKVLGLRLPDVRVRPRLRLHPAWIAAFAVVILTTALILDIRSSWLQSLVLPRLASRITYSLGSGPSAAIDFPEAGPYDWRLGYARMPVFLKRLENAGYRVVTQARQSEWARSLANWGAFPIWHEKSQAGLRILDQSNRALYESRFPQRVYAEFTDIPPLVVKTLLFIENRKMLDARYPYRNPAIDWDRLAKAAAELGQHAVDPAHPKIGGSTLATQLVKMRHSPEGRTHSITGKFWQIASASLSAYQDGSETLDAQKRIVRDYINSIPLAASPSQGEVTGLGDGLATWYGADLATVNRLLSANEASLDPQMLADRAKAYRQVLSLFLALREPSFYLVKDPYALAVKTDRYLRALAAKGAISDRLRDLALADSSGLLPRTPQPSTPVNWVQNKGVNSIRASLLATLGLNTTYDLDRLDLTVKTSLDGPVQDAVTRFLQKVEDPDEARKAGMEGYHLLDAGNASNKVIYSVTLYERVNGANVLRVQTDNYNQPLNINQGTRLELGSTAKLRTLVNYLQIIEQLHDRYYKLTPVELDPLKGPPGDELTDWAINYLFENQDHSLPAMLNAALDRKYSANPGEAFFTAGGLHVFENFEKSDNGRIVTVREAFHRSVNLVFIRLMRDIEHYYWYRVPGASPAILEDRDNPARQQYLNRFADQEGREFLAKFYNRYRDQSSGERLETVVKSIHPTALRLAVIYRSVRPHAGLEPFTAYLKAYLPKDVFDRQDPAELYGKYAIDKFNLQDRGYLAHIHPLELWLLNYLETHPQATFREAAAASAPERLEVYRWLLHSRYKSAQDKRIKILMEQDAFQDIFKAWKRMGYPFDSLVPSLATTIGVSGDTPAALADLVGILINDGVRYPNVRLQELHFGKGTPTETVLDRKKAAPVRLVSHDIAEAVRREMIGVVQEGTAARAFHSVVLPDGKFADIGGKTGTGDNRFETFGAHGWVTGSRVVNRTAAFVFFVGDRFFGVITAFVPGQAAGGYRFTSALPVQVFRSLVPSLNPLFSPAKPEPAHSYRSATMGSTLVAR